MRDSPVPRWHGHLYGLATQIHEISGLGKRIHLSKPQAVNDELHTADRSLLTELARERVRDSLDNLQELEYHASAVSLSVLITKPWK